MTRRIVITGLGAVSPLGPDVETLWRGLAGGRSGVRKIVGRDPSQFPCGIAAEALDLPGSAWEQSPFLVDRMAGTAAEEAWRDAGARGERCGLGLSLGWENQGLLDRQNPEKVSLLLRGVGEFQQRFLLNGPLLSCYSACAAGTQLVEEAARLIRRGESDRFLVGAADSRIHLFGLWGYARLGALARGHEEAPARVSRPFDRGRTGFVAGEGAGFVVLEEREAALRRGARIHAEILGAASTCDAFSVTAPRGDGEVAARAVTRCLERAGTVPEEIDYINAHGTGTLVNDAAEVRTLRLALGGAVEKIPVGSYKSMLGHLSMAAGLVELIGTVRAMTAGRIPPNLNLENPDFELNFAGAVAKEVSLRRVLKTSFGFGGQNSAILLGSGQA